MSKQAMSLGVVFTQFSKVLGLAGMIAPAVLLAGSAAWGGEGSQSGREAGSDRAIRLVTLAPVPVVSGTNKTGGMYSFDISFVDQVTQMYYLGDRSNAAVDVVDAKTGKFVTQFSAVPAFAGVGPTTATSGPNGVVADNREELVSLRDRCQQPRGQHECQDGREDQRGLDRRRGSLARG